MIPRPLHARPSRRVDLVATAVITAAALLACARPAAAVDGRLDVRGDIQEGRTGDERYETNILRVDSSLLETTRLARGLVLQLHYRDLREDVYSGTSAFSTEYVTDTRLPGLTLNLRRRGLRTGFGFESYRKSYRGDGYDGRREERVNGSAWLQGTLSPVRLQLNARRSESRNRTASLQRTESHEDVVTASLRSRFGETGDATYSFSHNRTESPLRDTRSTNTTHGLRLNAATGFDGGRGRATVEARTRWLRQGVVYGDGGDRELLVPLSVGVLEDDTPEIIDPLEPDPTPRPGLVDRDLDTPAGPDLGDAAPPVREYGGDYRNFVLDFGEPRSIGGAELHVLQVVTFPEFMRWRVFVSDDPEGRLWDEVPVSAFTAVYDEWDDGRRGWRFEFPGTLETRRLKLVDYKLGPTADVIEVAELEILAPADPDARRVESTIWRHRLDGELHYSLHRDLSLTYGLVLNESRFGGQGRDLTGVNHRLGAGWRRGDWSASASAARDRLRSGSDRNTDVRTATASVMRKAGAASWARLGWSRSLDRSEGFDRDTDSVSLDTSWSLAPDLRFQQKVGLGRREDAFSGEDGRSWTSISILQSRPRRSLSLNLRRTHRWVSAQAGAGFTRFNDTEADLHWSITPLLNLGGRVGYEYRDRGYWMRRVNLAWTPLRGGSVDTRVNLSESDDERTGLRMRTAGVRLTWRARPALRLDGGLEAQDYEREGRRSRPLNLQFRANWTF